MLIGMQELDVEEWEANTIYRNYNRNSKQVQWFWQVQPEICCRLENQTFIYFRLSENSTMKNDVVFYNLSPEHVVYL